jgi:hypothetical protein
MNELAPESRRLTFITSDPILTRGLRGRTWLAGGLLGLILGAGIYFATPPTYTATAVVELAALSPVIDLSPTAGKLQPFTVDSDVQLVVDGQVVSAISGITRQEPAQIRRSLTVSARQLTRVLQITYRAATPAMATAGAQGAADAFLAERDRLVVKPVGDYLTQVLLKTESPQKSAATLTTEGLTTRAQSRVEGLRARAIAAELQSKGAGNVLERARVRAGGDRGDVEIPVVTGAGLGVLIGVAAAMIRAEVKKARLLSRVRARAGASGAVIS